MGLAKNMPVMDSSCSLPILIKWALDLRDSGLEIHLQTYLKDMIFCYLLIIFDS
jgi:hypothetical protein